MFYKYINEDTIEKAPSILRVEGKQIYTNDEKIYNRHGYYRLDETPIPDTEGKITPKYFLEKNIIYKKWSVEPEDDIYLYWDSEGVKERHAKELNQYRDKILAAWDIYSKNVAYGIINETEEEHNIYIEWYKGICNKELWAFEAIPTEIRKHMR